MSSTLASEGRRRPVTASSAMRRPGSVRPRPSPRKVRLKVNMERTSYEHTAGVEDRLEETVQKRYTQMNKTFRALDREGSGQLSKAKFALVLKKYGLRLTEPESRSLAVKYDLAQTGGIAYPEFLRQMVVKKKFGGGSSRRPASSARRPMPPSSPGGPAPSAAGDESFRASVRASWKQMRKAFKACDGGNSGHVTSRDFRNVMHHHGCEFTESQFYKAISAYDGGAGGTVKYNDFIRDNIS